MRMPRRNPMITSIGLWPKFGGSGSFFEREFSFLVMVPR